MKRIVAIALALSAAGVLLDVSPAQAAQAQYYRYANAVDNCQAFTPGPSNTIRNRVVGAENVGTVPIAVACNFPLIQNGASTNSKLNYVAMWFTNANSSDVTVNCVLLTGTGNGPNGGTVFSSAQSVSVGPGASYYAVWGSTANPTPGATDLGNYLVGTNCTLPPNVTISATIVGWSADNGI